MGVISARFEAPQTPSLGGLIAKSDIEIGASVGLRRTRVLEGSKLCD
jgi:hypothetical protein